VSIPVVHGGRHPFQSAIEARDLDALTATLREDVAFHTPLRFEPFRGRDQALGAMTLAARAFAFQPGFRYTKSFREGSTLALFFEAQLQGKSLEGVDYLVLDDEDKVAELRVMMRPFSVVRELVSVTGALLTAAQGPPAESG
jgi:hypothetical protein